MRKHCHKYFYSIFFISYEPPSSITEENLKCCPKHNKLCLTCSVFVSTTVDAVTCGTYIYI